MTKINFLFLLNLALFAMCNAQEGVEIFNKMIESSKKVNALSFNATVKERFDGKLHLQKAFIKVRHSPFQIYYRQDYPQKGIEILYSQGKNQNKALVKPNQFPWVNMNLDPLNNQLRDKQHQTLFNPGFAYFVKVMEQSAKKYLNNLEKIIEYKGEAAWNNKDFYKLELVSPDYKLIKHIVEVGETIDKIAEKYYLNSYKILELNPVVKDYNDIKTGQEIIIPNCHTKKMILWVDKEKYVPMKLEIYDENGIFELYEFYNMKINLNFATDEFSPMFKDYGF
ncbi:MAG: DUF1571 domain-containing protein [Bacteroidota bacterium]